MRPLPQHGLDADYPLLYEKATQHDFAQRLGGSMDPLMAEIDAAMRELWDARRHRGDRTEPLETALRWIRDGSHYSDCRGNACDCAARRARATLDGESDDT